MSQREFEHQFRRAHIECAALRDALQEMARKARERGFHELADEAEARERNAAKQADSIAHQLGDVHHELKQEKAS